MSDDLQESRERADALIQTLKTQKEWICVPCQRPICSHEILFSIVMGYKNAPHCTSCLAEEAEKTAVDFREQIYRHIQQKGCWKMAWDWCNRHEGFNQNVLPSCLWHVS